MTAELAIELTSEARLDSSPEGILKEIVPGLCQGAILSPVS